MVPLHILIATTAVIIWIHGCDSFTHLHPEWQTAYQTDISLFAVIYIIIITSCTDPTTVTHTWPGVFIATQYSYDINRIKRIFTKHWKLIKNNTLLNQIFPAPPVIAYKANPSLKKNLVRARLKPLDQTNPNLTPNTNGTHDENQQIIEPNFPFNLFKHTSQNYRNPVKRYNNN